jgi:hypothetical protein
MRHVEARGVRNTRGGVDRLRVETGDDALEVADGAVEERSRHAWLHGLQRAAGAR